MFANKFSYINSFTIFLSVLVMLIPFAQVTGPFLTDLLISLSSLSYLIVILVLNRKFHYSNKFLNLLLIFWAYILLNSILSEYKNLTLKPSITFFRFIIFTFVFIFICKHYKTFLEKFNVSLIIVLSIIIFDGYFQFIFGKNIIGLEKIRPDRLSSFFHDELILGSFLSKFLPIIIYFYYQNINFKKIRIFNSIIIIFIIPLIFLSGERAAFFVSILFCILVMPFIFSIKKFTLIIFSFLIFSIIIINSNKIIYDRYVIQLKDHLILKKDKKTILFPEHIGLFNSAYENYLKNKLLGSGVKSFRKTCKFNNSDFKQELETIRRFDFCSTHPHNYYLQFLTELGLIGFSFIFAAFIFCLINYFKSLFFLFFKKKSNQILFKKYIILLTGLIVILWPLTTTGNFFNNYNSSFIFLHLGFFLNIKNEYNLKH